MPHPMRTGGFSEFLRNTPVAPDDGRDDAVQYVTFSIGLFYSLSPWTNSVEGDQTVLGRHANSERQRDITAGKRRTTVWGIV